MPKNKKKKSSKSLSCGYTSSVSSSDNTSSVAHKLESDKTTTKVPKNKKKSKSLPILSCGDKSSIIRKLEFDKTTTNKVLKNKKKK